MSYLIEVNVSHEIESSDRVFSTERLVKDIKYIEALNPQMLWGFEPDDRLTKSRASLEKTLLPFFGQVDSRLVCLGGVNEFVREPSRNLAAPDTAGGMPSQRNIVCVWYNILLSGYSQEFD